MEIRLLEAEDAPAYRVLRTEALLTEPFAFGSDHELYVKKTDEEVCAQVVPIEDRVFSLGAFIEGELVGGVTLWRTPEVKFRHGANLVAMFVTEQARGKGCGKALVGALIERARTFSGLEKISLSVSTCQESACRLYRSMGFVTWGHEKNALRVGDVTTDFEHMTLVLR
jgi:GNAT superfamily N-acetyltransferase